jgi:hypothetical protein
MSPLFFILFMVASGLTRPTIAQEPRFGGTFIGALICKDGIIIGSDSRSTFMNVNGAPMGYVDGMSKVFAQQETAFAVSGVTSIGDELFGSFVRRNEYILAKPVNEMLFDVQLRLPYTNMQKVLLLSAGFIGEDPMICAKDPISPQVCRKSGYITNKESRSLSKWQSGLRGIPSPHEAAAALKQAILESASSDATVGGPLTIVYLRKGYPPQWFENGSQDANWTRICDLVSDYQKNKIQIGFTNSKDELDRFLNAVCTPSKR